MPVNAPIPLADLSDDDLVRQFARSRSEAAFRELVVRHGPLVLSVCRRNTFSPADADDAFQATFLVLAQSARAIRRRRSLGAWLYGVACRVCARARRDHVRRRAASLVDEMAIHDDPLDELLARHDGMVVDEELAALPEHLRTPLVLRYLAGKPNGAVAKELGITVAALEGRLKRGKQRLRVRLIRRGVALAAVVAALKATRVAAGGVPESLVEAATGLCMGPPLPTAAPPPADAGPVTHLAFGELKAMNAFLIPKALAPIAITVAGVATLVVGTQLALSQSPDGDVTGGLALDSAVVANESEEAGGFVAPAMFQAPAGGDGASSAPPPADVQRRSERGGRGMGGEFGMDSGGRFQFGGGRGGGEPAASQADAVDLKPRSEIEKRVEAALARPLPEPGLEFTETPLSDVVRFLSDEYSIPIFVDEAAMQDFGLSSDDPVTVDLPQGLRLESALRLMLSRLELTYLVRDEVLFVTTEDKATTLQEVRVYPTENFPTTAASLREIIVELASPDTWVEKGGEGTIASLPETLLVRQTHAVHDEIADLLRQLRESQKQEGD